MNLLRFCPMLNEILSLPEVTIRMSGDALAKHIFEIYTKPHPKYKIIQNKRWGVALLRLPAQFEQYLKENELLRRKRRRSINCGFSFHTVDPSEHLEEILDINSSLVVRQGYSMDPSFLRMENLILWAKSKPFVYGVSDARGVLKAYTNAPVTGEVFTFSRLFGHGQGLDEGIMYFMVSEVVREMIDRKAREGSPMWGMYDTFFGAPEGLQFFKRRLGFAPYKVRWVWENRPANGKV